MVTGLVRGDKSTIVVVVFFPVMFKLSDFTGELESDHLASVIDMRPVAGVVNCTPERGGAQVPHGATPELIEQELPFD